VERSRSIKKNGKKEGREEVTAAPREKGGMKVKSAYIQTHKKGGYREKKGKQQC